MMFIQSLAYGWVGCADEHLHMRGFFPVSTFLVKIPREEQHFRDAVQAFLSSAASAAFP